MALYDKLSTINTALSRTGNSQVALDDNSPEWVVASDAYDTELALLIEAHDWNFARVFDALTANGMSTHPSYQLSYARPVDCLHIINVTLNTIPIDYDLVGSSIVTCPVNAATDPYVATNPVVEYIRQPAPGQWPEHFIEILRQRIMSHCYRGLNEDTAEADRVYQKSEETLRRAMTRSDQEAPPVKRLVSGMLAKRRIPKTGSPFGRY